MRLGQEGGQGAAVCVLVPAGIAAAGPTCSPLPGRFPPSLLSWHCELLHAGGQDWSPQIPAPGEAACASSLSTAVKPGWDTPAAPGPMEDFHCHSRASKDTTEVLPH